MTAVPVAAVALMALATAVQGMAGTASNSVTKRAERPAAQDQLPANDAGNDSCPPGGATLDIIIINPNTIISDGSTAEDAKEVLNYSTHSRAPGLLPWRPVFSRLGTGTADASSAFWLLQWWQCVLLWPALAWAFGEARDTSRAAVRIQVEWRDLACRRTIAVCRHAAAALIQFQWRGVQAIEAAIRHEAASILQAWARRWRARWMLIGMLSRQGVDIFDDVLPPFAEAGASCLLWCHYPGEYYPATFCNILAELVWERSWIVRFQAAARGLIVRSLLRTGDVAALRRALGETPVSTVLRFVSITCLRVFDLAVLTAPVGGRRGRAVALAKLLEKYGSKKKKASNKAKKLARDNNVEKFSGQFAWFGNELRMMDGPNLDTASSLRAAYAAQLFAAPAAPTDDARA